MTEALHRSPLFDVHVQWGARMVAFAGWSMPLRFTSIISEHVHTRRACSVFDVSHMGRLKLTGADGESFLNRLCTRNLTGAPLGRSYYTHMCRDDGGVLDDLIVSRFESSWGLVCNAANRGKILAWLHRHRKGTDVEVIDETFTTAMVAIQGPQTLELARPLVDIDLPSIGRYHFRTFQVMGLPIAVYRSGYTGEDGFEVVVPAGIACLLIPKLLGTKDHAHPIIKPAGLGARDTLRIEAAMPLYGHELHEGVDSLTAGQGWCVDLDKDFIGADAMRRLREHGLPRRLVGLELAGRRIARPHQKVLGSGRVVGEVTSGTLSPTLGRSIAMAIVDSRCAETGSQLEVEMGKTRGSAKVVRLPFYRRPT